MFTAKTILTINSNPVPPNSFLCISRNLAGINPRHVCSYVKHDEPTAHHPLTEDNHLPELVVHHLWLLLQVVEEHQEGRGRTTKVAHYVQLCQLRSAHIVVTVE